MSPPLIDPELLALMQCPQCGGELEERTPPPSLVCLGCGERFPVVAGVPDMAGSESGPEE